MSPSKTLPPDTPRAVQTASRISSRLCPGCGKAPLQGQQRVACSDRCRARVWRERRAKAAAETRQARDREIREHLKAALALLE